MKRRTWIISLCFLALTGFAARAQEALPEAPPIPKDNPQTPEKVELGKQLFFDPRISVNGTISCNSCHNVMAGGDDSRSLSAGMHGKLGARNSPTVWNSAFQSVQFWDGRAATLEEQAAGHLVNPVEMAMGKHTVVIERIKSVPGYLSQFKKVFGAKDPVTIDSISKSLAAYKRTLITPGSSFDRFLKGDGKAMTPLQQKGFEVFKSVGCIACHNGVNLNGPALPLGSGFYQRFPTYPNEDIEKKYQFSKDLGRFEFTKNEGDKNMWRVPTLRNVALTAPYFHNGAVETLDEAVRIMGQTQLNKKLSKREIEAVVAFLDSLTGEFPSQTLPRLPGVLGRSLVESR